MLIFSRCACVYQPCKAMGRLKILKFRIEIDMVESTLLSAMARLRIALRTLEADLGMGDLSSAELDALAATVQLLEEKEHFKAADLANHPLLDQISRASKYRAIQSLETRGLLTTVQHNGRKRYVLSAGQA